MSTSDDNDASIYMDIATFSKEILRSGCGDCIPLGASVTVKYTGLLPDGRKFDSTIDRDQPFTFNTGKGAYLPGLEDGLCSMKKDEHAILTILPKYGHGNEGLPPTIPPNTVLKFDVEVIDWQYEDLSPEKDRSIERRFTESGYSFTSPNAGALVEVHIKGKHKSEVFEDRDIIFFLGQGKEDNVQKEVELALKHFKLGEQSKIFVKPKHKCVNLKVPLANEMLEYDIQLKFFERFEDDWAMDEEYQIKLSEIFKEKGNQYFKEKVYIKSIEIYNKILDFLLEKDGEPIKKNDQCTKLILSAYLNVALCYLKTENYELARDAALKAVDMSSENVKAHYRCGQAFLGLRDHEKARDHFETCLILDPSNSEAKAQLSENMSQMKEFVQNEKKRYSNMFDHFSEMGVGEGKAEGEADGK